MLKKTDLNLAWLDLEMTGLEPKTDRIIEIAVVVTSPDLSVRVDGPVIAVHQSELALARMDAWNQKTHGNSGLIDRVRASRISAAGAEKEVISFLQGYVGAGKSPLCGNSIGQDRRFLVKYMPTLERFFHYRNLDVSTLKELARRWRPDVYKGFKKRAKHTALADVHESIDELAYYRAEFLKV